MKLSEVASLQTIDVEYFGWEHSWWKHFAETEDKWRKGITIKEENRVIDLIVKGLYQNEGQT